MRTSMTNWFKFPLALLMCSMVVSIANAQDETSPAIAEAETSEAQSLEEIKEPKKTRTKEERAALKAEKAEARRLGRFYKTQEPVEGFEPVDMYDGIASGEVEVVIKAKSSSDSNFFVKNLTDKPLAIQMPEAFSAVPVVRQFGGGGGGFGGGGVGGRGGGGGVFNVPAGKSGKISVKTVCLEEGKADPKHYIDYVVQPLEKLTTRPEIFEMVRMLANDEVAQPVAQAAAWNVENGLSWNELLVKNRVEHMDGSYERYFHPCLLYTSPSPRDLSTSRMPSSA